MIHHRRHHQDRGKRWSIWNFHHHHHRRSSRSLRCRPCRTPSSVHPSLPAHPRLFRRFPEFLQRWRSRERRIVRPRRRHLMNHPWPNLRRRVRWRRPYIPESRTDPRPCDWATLRSGFRRHVLRHRFRQSSRIRTTRCCWNHPSRCRPCRTTRRHQQPRCDRSAPSPPA